MSNLPTELRYTSSHEWLRDNGDGTMTVGISDHAQEALGDLVYIELPDIGRQVATGEVCAVVESVKAASDIYAPLAGEVVAVNEALSDTPELVNQSPWGDGWLFTLRGSLEGDLLDADGYAALVAEEG
jgi:glycine cleavage system H protein